MPTLEKGISSPTAGHEGVDQCATDQVRMSTDETRFPLCTPYVFGDGTLEEMD